MNPETSIPIIRLEVQRMKHTMIAALSEYSMKIDQDLRVAVERYCEPEHLGRVIEDAVDRELTAVLQEEIKRFFAYGKGRAAIREVVVKKLTESE